MEIFNKNIPRAEKLNKIQILQNQKQLEKIAERLKARNP